MSVPVVTEAVEKALGAQRVFSRLSAQKRRAFALDLALIAWACRCAWLVDVVAVPDPEHVYTVLLRNLRQIHSIFNGVEHLFEPCSQQSFFVNSATCQSGFATDVAFIVLHQDPQLLPGAPPEVLQVLNRLTGTPPLTLPPDLPSRTTVPLAGVLLGYPVAYVPAEATFLAQTTLDVYECRLRAPSWVADHTLLKFSCPAALAAAHPARLSPARLVTELTARFAPRIKDLGLKIVVEHTTEIMDRVAL
ncbi:hypothetical protein B0H11DRAFT_414113 [Mycena galericulata]|nr:hypothetical protein B0H11DRAFT_414113 [Mycena galericulata]